MIIFTSNVNLIQYVKDPVVFNLSSYYSGFNNITNLITNVQIFNNTQLPPNEFIYSPQFDGIYVNSIFNNNDLFMDFMKILMASYNGSNVVILIAHDDYRDAITESIIKLIQVRYGYNCWSVEDIEDLELLKESYFTPYGLLTLDKDIEQYQLMSYRLGTIKDLISE